MLRMDHEISKAAKMMRVSKVLKEVSKFNLEINCQNKDLSKFK